MKPLALIIYISLTFCLSSCFIADDVFSDSNDKKLTLQDRVEKAVESYIKNKSENFTYAKYGFSPVVIHKPKEIKELDELKSKLSTVVNTESIKEEIKIKEEYIKANNIGYQLEVDHTYSLKNKSTEIFETKFLLNDKFEVVSYKTLIALQLTPQQEEDFKDYFFESQIFITSHNSINKEFYAFLKQHQESLSKLSDKNQFLTHSLFLVNEIKHSGKFNHTTIFKKITTNYIKSSKQFEDYNPIQFSTLYEIKENNILKGYYFFHKFSHSTENEINNITFLVEFSPYYELIKLSEVEPPYEQYFK